MSEHIIKLVARFVDADTGSPLIGGSLRVRFLDRDAIKDDLLGEGVVGPDGMASVLTTTSSFRSGLLGMLGSALGEEKPDIYCEVLEGNTVVFRTEVAWNVNTEAIDEVTHRTDRTIDLGTFRFRRGGGLDDEPDPGEKIFRSNI
jgi:hypothetical protein